MTTTTKLGTLTGSTATERRREHRQSSQPAAAGLRNTDSLVMGIRLRSRGKCCSRIRQACYANAPAQSATGPDRSAPGVATLRAPSRDWLSQPVTRLAASAWDSRPGMFPIRACDGDAVLGSDRRCRKVRRPARRGVAMWWQGLAREGVRVHAEKGASVCLPEKVPVCLQALRRWIRCPPAQGLGLLSSTFPIDSLHSQPRTSSLIPRPSASRVFVRAPPSNRIPLERLKDASGTLALHVTSSILGISQRRGSRLSLTRNTSTQSLKSTTLDQPNDPSIHYHPPASRFVLYQKNHAAKKYKFAFCCPRGSLQR